MNTDIKALLNKKIEEEKNRKAQEEKEKNPLLDITLNVDDDNFQIQDIISYFPILNNSKELVKNRLYNFKIRKEDYTSINSIISDTLHDLGCKINANKKPIERHFEYAHGYFSDNISHDEVEQVKTFNDSNEYTATTIKSYNDALSMTENYLIEDTSDYLLTIIEKEDANKMKVFITTLFNDFKTIADKKAFGIFPPSSLSIDQPDVLGTNKALYETSRGIDFAKARYYKEFNYQATIPLYQNAKKISGIKHLKLIGQSDYNNAELENDNLTMKNIESNFKPFQGTDFEGIADKSFTFLNHYNLTCHGNSSHIFITNQIIKHMEGYIAAHNIRDLFEHVDSLYERIEKGDRLTEEDGKSFFTTQKRVKKHFKLD